VWEPTVGATAYRDAACFAPTRCANRWPMRLIVSTNVAPQAILARRRCASRGAGAASARTPASRGSVIGDPSPNWPKGRSVLHAEAEFQRHLVVVDGALGGEVAT
jgi:hypothetical protein